MYPLSTLKIEHCSWAPVAHTYHTSFLEGRDWITTPDQPGQKRLQDPISTAKKLGLVVCTSHPRYGRKLKLGRQ
jgi:hypothetical protein